MNIIKLKKKSFDIYYDTKLKYPIIVIEKFNKKLFDSGINRYKIGEPFKKDPKIPTKYSFYKKKLYYIYEVWWVIWS